MAPAKIIHCIVPLPLKCRIKEFFLFFFFIFFMFDIEHFLLKLQRLEVK